MGRTISHTGEKIENKRWNHFAISYDGTIRICYLNGEEVSRHDIQLRTAATPLVIGSRLDDQNHCFVGSIRNVAVYGRSLNPEEIKNLSRSGPALEQ